MTNTPKLGLVLAAFSVAALLAAGTPAAEAHPHDVLAQCQLPSGKWVMCDQTIHDKITNGHVPKNTPPAIGNFKAPTANPDPKRKLQVR